MARQVSITDFVRCIIEEKVFMFPSNWGQTDFCELTFPWMTFEEMQLSGSFLAKMSVLTNVVS